MWAASGAIPENKIEIVRTLLEKLEEVGATTPEEGRAVLMASQSNGYSLFNAERSKYASTDNDINRSHF